MKKILLFLLLLALINSIVICQKLELSTAEKVAISIFQKYNMGKDSRVSSIKPIGLKDDTLFYVVSFIDKGFILVSGNRAAPPILGRCSNDIYDIKKMPPGLLYLIEKYKYGISQLNDKKIIASKEVEGKWDEILSSDFNASKSYSVGT